MSNKSHLYLGTGNYIDVSVTNGNFNGNADGWTVPSYGWFYDSNTMRGKKGESGTLTQNIANIVPGTIYKVSFSLTFVGSFWSPSGSVTMSFAGVNTVYTTAGIKTEIITAVNTNGISFTKNNNYRGRLDNVSVDTFDNRYTWEEIHLADDESINLNFAIADIEDITKRGTTYSKSISVPSTVHNDKVFQHLYDLDVENDDKYLNKKIPARLYYDDAEILNGICEITKIDTLHANNQANYEIILRGDTMSFADIVSSKYITGNQKRSDDIDFSEYNHIFTNQNISATWANTYYPSKPIGLYGSGYYYPIINYGNIEDNISYNFEQLRPALYIKELWDKIFDDAGFTYESNFLDSTYFKSLITPFTGKLRTSDDELESRKFRAGLTSNLVNQSNSNNKLIMGPEDSRPFVSYRPVINLDNAAAPLDFFDNGGNYNTTGSKYVIPNKGMYNFNFYAITKPFVMDNHLLAAGQYIAQTTDAKNYPNPVMLITAKIQRNRIGVVTTMREQTYEIPLNAFTIQVGPNTVRTNRFTNQKIWINNQGYRKTFLSAVNIEISANDIQYEQGDEVYVELQLNNKKVQWFNLLVQRVGKGQFFAGIDLVALNPDGSGLPGLSFYNTPLASDGIFLGETMYMNSCLPTQVRQIDFINSIIRMFNLIVEEDKQKTRHLIIEPRKDYFASGGTIDWTSKLDRSQAIEIERIPTLIDKNVSFKYQEDEDKYNEDYQEKYEETYGDWYIKNDDLTLNEQEISIIFSPTPGDEVPGTDIIVPQIYNVDDNNKLEVEAYKMRILHRVDIIDYPGSTFNTANTSPNRVIAINEYIAGTIASTVWMANTIVTASHLDDPYNPAYDLNWGYSKEYYNILHPTTYSLPTWSNLYNEYWRDYIELLIDKNSKIITGQFNLTEQDIYNFKFNNKVKIDGQYYIVNRITDWNPDTLTEVELIKVRVSNLPTTAPDKRADTESVLGVNIITYKNQAIPASETNNTTVQTKSGTGTFLTATPKTRSMSTNSELVYPLSTNEDWNDLSGTTTISTTTTASTISEPSIVTPESRGFVTGVNNFVDSRNTSIVGNDNNFEGPSYNTMILGDGNTIGEEVNNAVLFGNNNIVDSNINNVGIIGNNLTVSKSDTLVIGAKTILSIRPIEPIINIVSSPNLDGKQINPFNRMKQVQVLSGGNISKGVRPLRSCNTTFIVNGRITPTTIYSGYAEVQFNSNGDPI